MSASAKRHRTQDRGGGAPPAGLGSGSLVPYTTVGGDMYSPTYSEESERAVLGAILLDPEVCLFVVRAIVGVEDFYLERHQLLYQTFLDLADAEKPIDLRTVQASLEQRKIFDEAGGISYLATLDIYLPDVGRIEHYAKIVRDRSRRRKLWESSIRLMQKASNGSTEAELLDAASLCSRNAAILVAESQPAEARYLTEEEIAAEVFPPPTWILGNFLAQHGATMLAGKPGAGKTWFALEFAMRLARGLDFLDLDCPDPRRVLYIAAEGNYGKYKHDMSRIAKGLGSRSPEGRLAVQIWDSGFLGDSAAQAALIQDCQRFAAEVVILDSLAFLFNLGNENDTDGWAKVNPFLLTMMQAGLSVLAIHHANKSDNITGSLSNVRAVDQALVLSKPEDKERDLDVDATLRYVKARLVPPQYTAPLTLHLTSDYAGPGSIGYLRVDAANDRRRLCVQVWDRSDQPSVKQVSAETGIPSRTVYRYLQTAYEARETRRQPRPYKE